MTWEADPLVVDGTREWVQWVAALPADWTTDGERFVLMVLACDAFTNESAPGADNLAAWTGMNRRSVRRILDRLLAPTSKRPALLVKANVSRGRATSRYQFHPQPGVTVAVQPTATQPAPTVTVDPVSTGASTGAQPAPTVTVNWRSTGASTGAIGHPPFPSPLDTPSLSENQRAVANALGMADDDEKLNSVDQMLKDNGAQKPMGWIRSCAKNGDLERLLDDAHGVATADQWKRAKANTEMDGLWARIVRHYGQDKAIELRDQRESDLAPGYPNGVPSRVLLMDLIIDLVGGAKAS